MATAGRVAILPADWWIASLDSDNDPCVWGYRPHVPRLIISYSLAGTRLWNVLAEALPNRGTCISCNAVACSRHTESAATDDTKGVESK